MGMMIRIPDIVVLERAAIIVAAALVTRGIGIWLVLYLLRAGHHTSLLSTFYLSQISEFSLVILSIGIHYGHLDKETMASVIWAFAILAVGSTYLATFSQPVLKVTIRILKASVIWAFAILAVGSTYLA